jgi:hypothetical protein
MPLNKKPEHHAEIDPTRRVLLAVSELRDALDYFLTEEELAALARSIHEDAIHDLIGRLTTIACAYENADGVIAAD